MIDIPSITDEAIHEVCKLLTLPQHAFHGLDGNDPRQEILKSMATMDIEACPGSGKTTLLVAKLDLLAKRWLYRTQGMCVLSHTNGARDEIEKRLGSTLEGQALLKYPHYIGTIHGFVNEFIAIPWLRSKGYFPNIIEDETALKWRWNSLPPWIQDQISRSPRNTPNPQKTLKIKNSLFEVEDINTGRNQTISKGDSAHTAITTICKNSYLKGFMCFDEMFIWANDALSKNKQIQKILRNRFPLLFIDETQDNSEIQSATLHKIFIEGEKPVTRQRFGDSNQAIFNYTGQSGATTDIFPSVLEGVRKELPNSHRFGAEIASLANNFTINCLEAGLQGHGPNTSKANVVTDQKHTIFLFNDGDIDKVLPEYAKHLLEVFVDDPKGLKQGDFVAVGAVHNTPSGKIQSPPHHIGHYYPDYKSELSKKEPSLKTFPEYIMVGKYLSSISGSTFPLIEKYSEALLKAAHIAGGKWSASSRKRKHNFILEALMETQEIADLHKAQILELIKIDLNLTKLIWEENWVGEINSIVRGLVGDNSESDKVAQFLVWPDEIMKLPISNESSAIPNRFHYPNQETPDISIRLGSIHSVKGQNHTATLILETFNRTYHLKKLKDWILGKNRMRNQINCQSDRLKLHYVAMTRPTHLLCLAMKYDSFSQEERESLVAGNNWNVKVL
jgi:DNA helicase II / ATP-dependent DNA helicase PcrA